MDCVIRCAIRFGRTGRSVPTIPGRFVFALYTPNGARKIGKLPTERRSSKRMSRADLMVDRSAIRDNALAGEQAAASRRSSKSLEFEAEIARSRRNSKSLQEARSSQRFYDGEHDILSAYVQSTSVEAVTRLDDSGGDYVGGGNNSGGDDVSGGDNIGHHVGDSDGGGNTGDDNLGDGIFIDDNVSGSDNVTS